MHNLALWYQQQVAQSKLQFEDTQLQLLQSLDQFLQKFSNYQSHRLYRLIQDHIIKPKLGYYIYGTVGRGKSMLMQVMYQFTLTERKLKIHFHEFMHSIYQQLNTLAHTRNPLQQLGQNLKRQYDIIYLDELHVADPTTAMILQGLFTTIFNSKIFLITSSNYHPTDLWPSGLPPERFTPTQQLLLQQLKVVHLIGKQDYRSYHLTSNQLFISQNTTSDTKLATIFAKLNRTMPYQINTNILINLRLIPCRQYAKEVIWFDFAVLCGTGRSQLDYLVLSQRFQWFIISNIYELTATDNSIAQRFLWLIDVLYANNCGLSLAATVTLDQIRIVEDNLTGAFTRALSRLNEMQTQEYLAKITMKATFN